ncbi:hypothetical protein Tsp_11114, partial [Trichinella spiralis]
KATNEQSEEEITEQRDSRVATTTVKNSQQQRQ